MLSKLKALYPLQSENEDSKLKTSIRGISFASGKSFLAFLCVKNFAAEDEESVSAALGYVAHVILLLSKYLNVITTPHWEYYPLFALDKSAISTFFPGQSIIYL